MTTVAGNPNDPGKGQGNPNDPPKTPAWREKLPEDIRGEKVFDNFKGETWDEVGPVLAKSFHEGQKLVGKRVEGMVRLPAKDAKPEDIAAYRRALGVPETPEQYELTQPYFPEGMHDPAIQTAFLKEAHNLGLSPAQVQGLLDWNAAQATTTHRALLDAQTQSKELLQKDWGAAYPVNIALAQRAVHWLGGDDLFKLVDESPWGNHPLVLQALVKLGKELANDGLIDGKVDGVPSKEEAQVQIDTLMGDRKGPYWNRNHPGHEAAIQEVFKLRQIIAG